MKKLVLLMFVPILFIHLSSQAQAGGCFSCCRDDSSTSHVRTRPVRSSESTENDPLLNSSASSATAPTTSGAGALVVYKPFPGIELSIPTSFQITNLPGDVITVSAESHAKLVIYPSLKAAEGAEEYQSIKKIEKAEIKKSNELLGQLTKVYQAIQNSGQDKVQTQQLVALIQQIVDKFPVGRQNSYKLVRSTDKKSFRICIELEDGRIVLILISGKDE
ncbi:MAG: hypothetical protein ACD_16C00232G0024 [uncultured bacterium]|nr:MAG: hypothetical protein ACD_16C00232G0024 [uncultured bacterium]OFW68628.1 MAG: hypothetical protein A2X70_01430 [Alphaproteobacteria bacterium GWC2_42_16]OFW73067.1 MAG: hypothetical protein A2Z80_00060 [Alphaproteobacteria bacterium GWA2_41_27]OFW81641.1 MAG: hypothetical protein A3E50_00060 [Alphaproteobacteria bacterium RIFCSPHIGHO2_12_FULL_42_100]OFW85283.1 MAG: hypothetical protein A2W06_00185 [Alphaproteobacteria bacterium RBG_16_42_14]OFW90541.1 MAG: hypothetical protein A3C41_026